MSKPVRTNHAYRVDSFGELFVIIFRVIRCVIRTLFRYRTECMLLSATLAGYFYVDSLTCPDIAGAVLMTALALLLAPPKPRGLVLGRLRCARTRRALKSASREERFDNTLGQAAFVLRSRITHAGESYSLYLRAGQSAEQIGSKRESMRATLHARDVRIDRDPNRSHLVTVHVIRRDALAGVKVTSPLVELVSEHA